MAAVIYKSETAHKNQHQQHAKKENGLRMMTKEGERVKDLKKNCGIKMVKRSCA